jgi:hypothetical protein
MVPIDLEWLDVKGPPAYLLHYVRMEAEKFTKIRAFKKECVRSLKKGIVWVMHHR